MAHLAAQPHKAGMDFRFLMTGRTNNLAILKWLSLMAIGTHQFSVFACELKNSGMIEIRHAVHAVVTISTCTAERSNMTGHKIGILKCVAFLAGKSRRVIGKRCMALQTGNWIAAKSCRMNTHRKTGLLMIEWLSFPGSWQPGLPFMALTAVIGKDPGVHCRFLMTCGAFGTGYREGLCVTLLARRFGMPLIDREAGLRMVEILPCILNRFKVASAVVRMAIPALDRISHITVNSGAAGQLCTNILMAFRAQAGLIAAQGLMAQAALILKFCMGKVNTGGFSKSR